MLLLYLEPYFENHCVISSTKSQRHIIGETYSLWYPFNVMVYVCWVAGRAGGVQGLLEHQYPAVWLWKTHVEDCIEVVWARSRGSRLSSLTPWVRTQTRAMAWKTENHWVVPCLGGTGNRFDKQLDNLYHGLKIKNGLGCFCSYSRNDLLSLYWKCIPFLIHFTITKKKMDWLR
jgi:hypothetical protein